MTQTQWEYRIEKYGSAWRSPKREDVEAYLNALGDEGWEVINLHHPHSSNQVWITVKRPMTSTRRRRRLPGEEW